jgi:hypothetical protein
MENILDFINATVIVEFFNTYVFDLQSLLYLWACVFCDIFIVRPNFHEQTWKIVTLVTLIFAFLNTICKQLVTLHLDFGMSVALEKVPYILYIAVITMYCLHLSVLASKKKLIPDGVAYVIIALFSPISDKITDLLDVHTDSDNSKDSKENSRTGKESDLTGSCEIIPTLCDECGKDALNKINLNTEESNNLNENSNKIDSDVSEQQ